MHIRIIGKYISKFLRLKSFMDRLNSTKKGICVTLQRNSKYIIFIYYVLKIFYTYYNYKEKSFLYSLRFVNWSIIIYLQVLEISRREWSDSTAYNYHNPL